MKKWIRPGGASVFMREMGPRLAPGSEPHVIARAASVCLAAWATMVLCVEFSQAAPMTMDGLTVELVSEEAEIQLGKPFAVGLSLVLSEGFHTYWKNPGIVGVPTGLQWELPEGFKAGPIEWPAPRLTKMAVYPVYGYEGKTLLPVVITAPGDWGNDSESGAKKPTVTLKVKASWMCCAKSCHPGFAELSLELPVIPAGSGREPTYTKWRPDFEKTRSQFPQPADGWSISASREGKTVTIDVLADGENANRKVLDSLDEVYFFSGDGLIDSREEQKAERLEDRGFRLILTVSEFEPDAAPGAGGVPMLSGVLSSKQSWLLKKSVQASVVDVPLKFAKGASPD